MIRLLYSIFLLCFMTSPAIAASDRVALFVSDPASPKDTCQLGHIAETLKELRFEIMSLKDDTDRAAMLRFAKLSEAADAAMIYVCNPSVRDTLPDLLNARKLNFLFLMETASAEHGAAIEHPVKTERDDLMIVHARLDNPENEEIFSRTLTHKLRRPYTPPADILSRTVVSSYYRSRGSMVMEVRGSIKSDYILAKPPTEKILDAWSRVQHSKDRRALEAFIAQYPKTLFSDLARSRLDKLSE